MDQYPLLSMVSAEVYWVVSFAVLASFPATIGFLWKLGALRAGRAAAGIGLCFLVSSGVIVLPMWGHDILSIIFNYLVALVPNVTCLGVLVFLGIGAGALSRRFSSSAPEY